MSQDVYFETTESSLPSPEFKRDNVVRMHKEDNKLDYPLIMLSCDTLEVFRIEALKGILDNKTLLNDNVRYNIYINIKGELVKIGTLVNTKLRSLLGNKVFSVFKKTAYLDKDTCLEGDMVYALCVANIED